MKSFCRRAVFICASWAVRGATVMAFWICGHRSNAQQGCVAAIAPLLRPSALAERGAQQDAQVAVVLPLAVLGATIG